MLPDFAEQGLTFALVDESARTSLHTLAKRPTGVARHVRAYLAIHRLYRRRPGVLGKRTCLEPSKANRHIPGMGRIADLLRSDLPVEIAP